MYPVSGPSNALAVSKAARGKRRLGAKVGSHRFSSTCHHGDCSVMAVAQSLCAKHLPNFICSHVGVDNEQCKTRASIKSLQRELCLCEPHFRTYLIQKRRDANWKRRFPFLYALVGSKLRETAAVKAAHRIVQAALDKSAKLPPVPRMSQTQNRDYLHGAIFSHEPFVRSITAYL